MIKKKIIGVLVLLVLLLGCSEENTQVSTTEAELNTEDVNVGVLIDTVNVYMGLSYYLNPGKDYKGLLKAGEAVKFTGNVEIVKDKEYYEIVLENNERVWALSSYLYPNSKTAVIKSTSEIFLFDKNNDNAISRTEIDSFRIVAVDTELEDDTFSKISWNVKDSYSLKTKYVVSDDLSFNQDDIEFAKVVTRYLDETDKGVKEELFSTLKEFTSVCSSYKKFFASLDNNSVEYFAPDVSVISPKYSEYITFFKGVASTPLSEEASMMERDEEFEFALLDYFLLNSSYTEGVITLEIYNTSSFDLSTIPGEVEIVVGDKTYYAGVVGGYFLSSGDSFRLSVSVAELEVVSKNINLLNIRFVNNYILTSKINITVGDE